MTERNTLADFTEQEREAINDMHRREFADMTPDDVQLYAEWVAFNAKQDAELMERQRAIQDATAATIEMRRETEKAALDTLDTMKELALARLEAVKNGKA